MDVDAHARQSPYLREAGSDIRISVPVHGSTSLKRGLQRHLMKLADIDDTEF